MKCACAFGASSGYNYRAGSNRSTPRRGDVPVGDGEVLWGDGFGFFYTLLLYLQLLKLLLFCFSLTLAFATVSRDAITHRSIATLSLHGVIMLVGGASALVLSLAGVNGVRSSHSRVGKGLVCD